MCKSSGVLNLSNKYLVLPDSAFLFVDICEIITCFDVKNGKFVRIQGEE